jgi:hypothetical protein
MFVFNATAMEAFGAFGEDLSDVLKDEDIAQINDWDDYVALKKRC